MLSNILLRADGVSLALSADGLLPEVVHWGADLGSLTEAEFDALALARTWPLAPNSLDREPRYGILLEERFGWLGKPGLIGSRRGKAWTPAWELAEVLLDGVASSGYVVTGAASVRYVARAEDLELRLIVELTDQGLVKLRADLTNLADEEYEVGELTLALPAPRHAEEVLDFGGRWGAERMPQRTALGLGSHRRENRRGRTGADSAYILHLGTSGFDFSTGETWAVHTAWSGNHIHFAERDFVGFQAIGGGELLLPGEVRLSRGDSYETPWLFFNWGIGLDAQADRFHRYQRALPAAPDWNRPVALNVWEAVYFDHDLDRLIDLAERAARLGVERYVVDDGWFGARRDDSAGLGDWVVAADVWPDGLHPLVDRVKDLGMQFGLWFEPEMVNLGSDVARAHPEWVMQPGGRLPIESRHQHVLNLSIPGAWQHVHDQLDAILSEYRIDYVKWDHNRDLIDAGTAPDGRPAVHEQTKAFYRLLDALRAAHPGVEFESCSSGGARIDLEVMSRAERVWVSDVTDPAERQRMLIWTSQLLPPEYLGSHIAAGVSHQTRRWHGIDFRAATAVFGHLGIEWDLAKATPEELEAIGWWLAWYKTNRRTLLTGRLVRCDLPDPNTYFKGVVTPEKAIFSLAVLNTPATASLGTLRFPGLDPDASYRVRTVRRESSAQLDVPWAREEGGIVLSGRTLATAGLNAPTLVPESAVILELDRLEAE
ncbi:alpha-galactosidase [Tessaracoccus sp. OS52]|uniref:alpha-galactosidase n=1 Tax=Tessaracoccus sp. OS52 TaxID=2886691 RepID=UPI001D0FD052|nr:alpha-galactosidase [Tessaracoccus sp. OS52]MCC2594449.1 alpha-galactosidase [Tessaracoccus sp. OS52]